MKEIYNNLKKEESLLIIKSGIFYITFEKDAIIMNNIFGYMIKIIE